MSAERRLGRVVWFKDHRGYGQNGFGFIRPDGSDEDVFFHWSYLKVDGYKTVRPDARVSFSIGENHKGPMAIAIEIEADQEGEPQLRQPYDEY